MSRTVEVKVLGGLKIEVEFESDWVEDEFSYGGGTLGNFQIMEWRIVTIGGRTAKNSDWLKRKIIAKDEQELVIEACEADCYV